MGDWLQDRCNSIQKAQQEHIQKSLGNDIEKAKSASIGEIHIWNGKKFKKQLNGKWTEVSEHGLTKKQHISEGEDEEARALHTSNMKGENKNLSISERTKKFNKHIEESNKHHKLASKLSDKEYSDEEVGVKNK